jgi:hypothetical protein
VLLRITGSRRRVRLTAADHLQSRGPKPAANDNGRRGFVRCIRLLDGSNRATFKSPTVAGASTALRVARPVVTRDQATTVRPSSGITVARAKTLRLERVSQSRHQRPPRAACEESRPTTHWPRPHHDTSVVFFNETTLSRTAAVRLTAAHNQRNGVR